MSKETEQLHHGIGEVTLAVAFLVELSASITVASMRVPRQSRSLLRAREKQP